MHSLKLAIALMIGYILTTLLKLPRGGAWVLVTIIVVMIDSRSVGALSVKSYLRALGTLLGAFLGIFTIYFHDNQYWIVIFELFVFSYLVSYYAKRLDIFFHSGMMTLVTLVLLLVVPEPNIQTAYQRVGEIFTGILIAYLVSRFVFPIRAERLFLVEHRENQKRMGDFLRCSIIENKPRLTSIEAMDLDKAIHNSLSHQRTILSQSDSEGAAFYERRQIYQAQYDLSRKLYRILLGLDSKYHSRIGEQTNLLTEIGFLEFIKCLADGFRAEHFPVSSLEQQFMVLKEKLLARIAHFDFDTQLPWYSLIYALIILLECLTKVETAYASQGD